MVPEFGHFAIILSLCFGIIQSFPLIKLIKPSSRGREALDRGDPDIFTRLPHSAKNAELAMTIGKTCVIGQFIFLTFAMLCLISSFINNDLTVVFVREHSHHLLPLLYRIGAAWGGHEGSLLLWCLILSGWMVAFVLFANKALLKTPILMLLGMIHSGFIAFLLFTSNPFKRDFPRSLMVGNDLTPILQDPGLIFHPPMLYSGYVGFAISFALAVAALMVGKLDKEWARACRPWVILPWSLLSFGIVLGSWWAYRELGWGGWWFWDPVENASLLPWLAATALIHSLIVSEKRESFQGWTILLAIMTFALCLLGTFLVRSGVVVSVHAFANDPERGLFLLAYFAFIIGGALIYYFFRIPLFYKAPHFHLFSRETFMLMNTVILVTAVATIIIGTLYPIVLDALHLEKISVGEPYFNSVFVPMMLPLLLLMGAAPHVHWQHQSIIALWEKLSFSLLMSIVITLLSFVFFHLQFYLLTSIGIFTSVWVIIATMQYLFQLQTKIAIQHWAMIVAHLGIAIIVLGVTVNKSYSEERQVRIAKQESAMLAGYQFTLKNIYSKQEANYKSLTALFSVQKNKNTPEIIEVEQRTYQSNQETLSKTGILVNAWRDLYLALGSSFADGSWSVRIYYKPFVRWIWFGGFLLLLGGFISLISHFRTRKNEI